MKAVIAALIAGCTLTGCGDTVPQASAVAGSDSVGLPLQRGFYVASDVPCGEASGGTLLLVRADGINGSHDSCDFRSVERTAATTYRVTQTCQTLQGEPIGHLTSSYEITQRTQFSFQREGSDHRSHYRYCDLASLPDPWRDADIADLMGDAAHY